MSDCLINGVATDYLSIHDRAIHYGDGLFETILCHNRRLHFWSQHYLRLKESADKIKLACPDEDLLLADIRNLLDHEEGDSAFAVKIIITRGTGQRGYQIDKNTTVTRVVTLSPIEKSYSSILSKKLLSGDLTICEQQVSINENLAGLKHLNRLENVLARNETSIIDNSHIIDGLMLNANNNVIEGSMSNVFSVKEKVLYTPKLNQSGVLGVMRDAVIMVAKNNSLEVSISDMTIEDIKNMDEVFITNSLIGMKAINHLVDTGFTERNVSEKIFNSILENMDSHVQVIQ